MNLIIDFHVHSIYSKDAILSPEKIIRIARRRGLSGVAVTDHDTIRGAMKTKFATFDDFIVVIGAEVKTDRGEIIGLFLNEEIKSREFVEVIEEIKDQDGIIVLPHPYRNKQSAPEDLLSEIDMIEGLNARIPKVLNYKAQCLARDSGLPMIGGSDAHTPFEIGRARTVIPGTSDIKDCLLRGKGIIEGRESLYPVRMLSVMVGKYRRDGIAGLLKAGINKMKK